MTADHDQIFKQVIESFFREFLELFFPDEAQQIDFDRIEFLRDEMFTELIVGDWKHLDLVAKVGLTIGEEKFVLIHIEIQSFRQADFAERMYFYYSQLMLRHRREILPIAIFADQARWRTQIPNRFEIQAIGRPVLQFEYQQIKLKHLDYRTYLRSGSPLAYALMTKMTYNRKDHVRLKADFLRLMLNSAANPAKQRILFQFIETYMPLDTTEQVDFRKLLSTQLKSQSVANMITIYEQEGIEKGIKLGQLQERRRFLLLLLEQRMGLLSPSLRDQIESCSDADQQERMLLATLSGRSPDEVGM